MRTVFNFTARDRVPFTHRGEEESEGWRARVSSFPGLKARPFELSLSLSPPAFQPVSQLHGPRFQKCIRMRRPCVYNLPDETGPSSLSKDGRNYSGVRRRLFFQEPSPRAFTSWDFHRNTRRNTRPTWITFENDRFLHWHTKMASF